MNSKSIKTAEGKLTPDDIATGSTIAGIMGLNPFTTANDILARAFDATQGIPRKELTFEALHWGTTFEVHIVNEACARLGLGNPKTTFGKAYFHEHYPMAVSLDATVAGDGMTVYNDYDKNIICANADSIVLDGIGVIEGKLTSNERQNELPDYRGKIQLQMAMDITGAKWGAVTVLHRGIFLMTHVFQRDEEMIARIRDAAVDFNRRVKKYVEAQETEWYQFTTTESASKIFDKAIDDEISLPELEADVQSIQEIQADIKDLTTQLDITQARIMGKMGDYKRLRAGRYDVVWGELHYKAVPEKVVPAKEARIIRVSKLKVKENDNV
jgi:hypothetical protein